MGDGSKSPLEIMLEEARKAELEALERQLKVEESAPKLKKPRPDFHNLKVIQGGKK